MEMEMEMGFPFPATLLEQKKKCSWKCISSPQLEHQTKHALGYVLTLDFFSCIVHIIYVKNNFVRLLEIEWR